MTQFNLTERDKKAISKYDKDFVASEVRTVNANTYPSTYRYILLLLNGKHDSGYTIIKVLGKGTDRKFYCVESYDYVDFQGAIKIDYFGYICRAQAIGKRVTVRMGIYKLFLEDAVSATTLK